MALFGPRIGHDALFDEVCRFHNIDRKTKTLLQTVIKKYQMQCPAEIFIDSNTLIHAMNEPEWTEIKSEIQKLYNSWFIEPTTRRR